MRPNSRSLAAALATSLVVAAGCGTEVVKYTSVHLLIKSEVPTSGTVTRLDISILSPPGADGKSTLKYPPADGSLDELFKFPLPDGSDITGRGYTVQLKQKENPGPLLLRVLGQDDNLKVLTAYSGVIDTSKPGLKEILLRAPDPVCDADGDGARDCSKEGCCAAGEASDCDDSAKEASPFSYEDPCTQCDDKIDEDCDGKDTPCVDSDKDGTPDCQEGKCGAGAEQDDTVYPGAPELCDSKDNDCDGSKDEGLPYTGVDGKAATKKVDDACGAGACAGGVVRCSADGKGLVCSTAGNKAAKEDCDNNVDDDCNGKVNDGCALQDIDADGVPTADEKKACKNPYAPFHPEFYPKSPYEKGDADHRGHCCLAFTEAILAKHPDWSATNAVPADTKATDELLAKCDYDCDGKIVPCAENDKDGDGVPAGVDCKDDDPTVFGTYEGRPGAPEKCGDGIDQDCVAGDRKSCAKDQDGDGYDAEVDCDDADKTVHPGAQEVCDGRDDDCDGVADEGNPEAEDAKCGDPDGECGLEPGVSVCKHWPAEREPGALDCLQKALDPDSRTCVGCEGDRRPVQDICDTKDNDCDGQSDEDYAYKQQKDGKELGVGATCDGVGECGTGKVECNAKLDKAVCDTDPNGSKKGVQTEVCDNKDNNCDGVTDENLTAIADASCSKLGACSGKAIQLMKTVCKAGKWVCDYAKVPHVEINGDDKCQPGDAFCHCPGLGTDCRRLHESTCDGIDNDCSGQTDEDFVYVDTEAGGKEVQKTFGTGHTACGTGFCYGGKVVCTADGKGLTCSTKGKSQDETCNFKDNDCNGLTDDGMTVKDSNCKRAGVCTKDNVQAECKTGKWVCDYSGVPDYEGPATKSCDFGDKACKYDGSIEKSCDDKDNDCDGLTDEDFAYLDIGAGGEPTKLLKEKGCGTGVCEGGKVVCTADHKGLTCDTITKKSKDVCDTKDNDCNGRTDEDFHYTQQDGKKLGVGATCDGIGACGIGKVECTPGRNDQATCSTDPNGSKAKENVKKEICDDADNDCNGKVDEGCDDDADEYCDAAMFTPAKPKTCIHGGGDCKDQDANFNPGTKEVCDGKDQDCNGQTDEVFFWAIPYDPALHKSGKLGIGKACGPGACAGGTIVCDGPAKVRCTSFDPAGKTGKNKPETICDNIDNDCDGLTDEGCDDDGDDYCDQNLSVVGKPKVCPKGGGDCNDDPGKGGDKIYPSRTELCNDLDDDCEGGIDEGCDDDGDDWCDAKMLTVGKPKVCPRGGGDCADKDKGVHPTAQEICNGKDDDCDNRIDVNDGDLMNARPPCGNQKGVCAGARKLVKLCVSGKWTACTPKEYGAFSGAYEAGSEKTCDNRDNNCSGVKDEGCDDDGDKYCDAKMKTVGTPKVCPKGGGDCRDQDQAIHPGRQEVCNGLDDDCDAKIDADDPDLGKVRPLCENQKGVCGGARKPIEHCVAGKWKTCSKADYQVHSKLYDSGTEKRCDNKDNDCDAKVDEGCDDDGDGYCDAAMVTSGTPKVCPKGGGDCHDAKTATKTYMTAGKNVHPGRKEDCGTSWDDNCNLRTNEENADKCIGYYRDIDGDQWGGSASACYCAPKKDIKFTALKTGDCDDGAPASSSYSWTNPDGKKLTVGSGCGMGVCAGGTVLCKVSKATCSTVGKSITETCNGKDDDCDGVTDNSLNLQPAKECRTKGICAGKKITVKCSKAKIVCNYSKVTGYEAVEESCNGLDDDCDDSTDEPANLKMSIASCSKAGKYGVCKGQTPVMKCVSGQPTCTWPTVKTYQSTENKCDTLDNDCDGKSDENTDFTGFSCETTKGVCKGSSPVKKCVAGKKVCDYGSLPGYEKSETRCDDKDNDCDGKTDSMTDMTLSVPGNGATPCVQGICTTLNVSGTCTAGKWTCDAGKVAGFANEVTSTTPPLLCSDGKDNDCDGLTDSQEANCP